MKATKKMTPIVAMIAIVCGLAMVVAGAGILSNTLTVTTHVKGAELSQVDIDTTHFCAYDNPNLPMSGGDASIGTVYDYGIRLTSAMALGDVVVHYEIAKTGIDKTDLTVSYGVDPTPELPSNGDGIWLSMMDGMTDNGNTLTGTFPVTVGAGYDATMFFTVQYNATGDYVATVYLTAA